MTRQDLIAALRANRSLYGVNIESAVDRLADYYELLIEHNSIMHLVAPCSAEEFATRHILESLTMLEFLPKNANFIDIGSGGGLPALPCLIVRDDLTATLVESKAKKAAFLELAIQNLGLDKRASVENKQFAEVVPGRAQFVSCRAIDKFTELLPRILKWAERRNLLLFGGPAIRSLLQDYRVPFVPRLMPLSEQRYLFISKR
ncbi:MAG TPA: class I SAM-dependent methyltransferase [Pyrinomonadaceae bacterium]|nr:class I SAM-dependent methyltransferase [Pyrinomonadaceae bacterium]